MIEIFGLKFTYDTLIFLVLFIGSEVIGSSRKFKNNSLLGLIKALIDSQKPFRKEDNRLDTIKVQLAELYTEITKLGK